PRSPGGASAPPPEGALPLGPRRSGARAQRNPRSELRPAAGRSALRLQRADPGMPTAGAFLQRDASEDLKAGLRAVGTAGIAARAPPRSKPRDAAAGPPELR